MKIHKKYLISAGIGAVVIAASLIILKNREKPHVQAINPVQKQTMPQAKRTIPARLPDIQVVTVRKGPPSKRSFNDTVVTEKGFIPATEFRKWDKKQWANRIKTLQQNGKVRLARQYLETFRAIHPGSKLALK